jgi:hypothetical protein
MQASGGRPPARRHGKTRQTDVSEAWSGLRRKVATRTSRRLADRLQGISRRIARERIAEDGSRGTDRGGRDAEDRSRGTGRRGSEIAGESIGVRGPPSFRPRAT